MDNITRGGISYENVSRENFPDLANTEPNGQINFDMHHVGIRAVSETEIEITFGGDTNFYFSHPDKEQVTVWFKALEQHILTSSGLSTSQPQKNFDKFKEVTESQFLEIADTGDMMFFKQQNAAAKTISMATGGHFSHVAFLYKDPTEKNDIVYYEAVSEGVGHTWWSEVREHIGPEPEKFYEKVCFRKLNIKRDDKFMEEI